MNTFRASTVCWLIPNGCICIAALGLAQKLEKMFREK
jgi:hypothetical protein